MFDIGNTDYTRIYIKRQEELLLDQIKKSVDLDVKVTMLSSILEDLRREYTDLHSQLQQQIELTNQAANGVQELTIQKDNLELKIENLKQKNDSLNKDHQIEIENMKQKLAESDRKLGELIFNRETVSSELDSCLKRNDDLERELVRQQKEMQEIFDENKELKSKKLINKKKTVDDSDF